MKSKSVTILFLAVILVTGFFYWRANYGKVDKSAALKKVLSPVFLKFGLTDDKLVKKAVEENKLGGARYISTYIEYEVPKSFAWRNFDPALRAALKRTGFIVFDVEQTFEKDKECYAVIINYGKFDVLTLKINRRGRPVAIPVTEKVYAKPKVAIVVDDFGYSKNNLDAFLGLKQPITLSILPEQRYTREVALQARAHGFETILHLPLEPGRDDVGQEVDTIKTNMGEKEIALILKKEIALVPGIDGVSNHMGSKATADRATMTSIIKHLKSESLYYFDSLTSSKSVCVDVARSLGVKCAKRDLFLDNSNNTAAIEKQLADLEALAFKRGEAIAICHDRKNTAAVLIKELPRMAKDGIEFVRLSELVKK
ncbi:MAG: divergent polysaccharide deacetylase family protein [Candidatus Omnitrophica bacterium]|nr:divergent polysaccharide deacetylase family protein [Candidatus Omnitrophota bacterium]